MRYHLLISNKLTRSYGKLSLIYHRANRIFYCSLVQQPHLFSLEIATFSYLGRCSSSSTMCLRHRPCLLCCPDDEALVYNSKVLCMRCFFFQIQVTVQKYTLLAISSMQTHLVHAQYQFSNLRKAENIQLFMTDDIKYFPPLLGKTLILCRWGGGIPI